MRLLIDIGNSTVVVAASDAQGNILATSRFKTDKGMSEETVASNISISLAKLTYNKSEERREDNSITVSSVVPELNAVMASILKKQTGIAPHFVTYDDVARFMAIDVDEPHKVGIDRLVDALGTVALYGAPAIIIDMGTATTVGIVDSRSAFIGGMIMPGINTSLRALQSRASLLPAVEVEAPPSLIGRNTIHCMQSGIVYGNACMTDGIIDRISRQYDCDFTVVATGGMAKVIVPYCLHPIVIDPLIQLRGLYRLSCISQGEA